LLERAMGFEPMTPTLGT